MEHDNITGIGTKGLREKQEDFMATEFVEMEAGRPLMGRVKNPYSSSLSSRQMESLKALCDTYLPSTDGFHTKHDESTARFYQTSASMAGTPQRVRVYHLFR